MKKSNLTRKEEKAARARRRAKHGERWRVIATYISPNSRAYDKKIPVDKKDNPKELHDWIYWRMWHSVAMVEQDKK